MEKTPENNHSIHSALEYLTDIIRKTDDQMNIRHTPWRHELSFGQWDYPACIEHWGDEDLKRSLELAGCDNINDPLEPVKTMYKNIYRYNDHIPVDNERYVFYLLSTAMRPREEHKRYFNCSFLNFCIVPSWTAGVITSIDIGYCRSYVNDGMYIFMHAKPLNILNPSTEEKEYLDILCSSIELLCKMVKIPTLQNNGNFDLQKLNRKTLIEEFIHLTQTDEYLSKVDLKKFKKYLMDPMIYRKALLRDGVLDEDEYDDYDYNTIVLELCKYYMHVLHTDWKFDHERLSRYISAVINTPFNISYEAAGGNPKVFVDAMSEVGEYPLLNLFTGGDDYIFFICSTKNKERLLEVSHLLDIPLNPM